MDYKTGDIRYRIVVDTGRADCNQDEMLQLCCTNAENAVDLYRDTVLELVLKSLEGPPNDAYIQKVKNTFNFFKDLKHEVVEILTSAFREERLATGGGVG